MAYDNISTYISRISRRTLFLWSLYSLLTAGLFFVYYQENQKHTFLKTQIVNLTEISNQATAVLYYNSQSDIKTESPFNRTLLKLWLDNNSKHFEELVPGTTPEINILFTLGQDFFQASAGEHPIQVKAFEELNDQLELLKRLASNHMAQSPFYKSTPIVLPILGGLFFILLFLTLSSFRKLKKDLMSKNEIILEDIWSELLDIELETNSILPSFHPSNDLPLDLTQTIADDAKYISIQVSELREAFITYINNTDSPAAIIEQNPQIKERIAFVQKLLSRLFTRAERATSLAKASVDNGFQAGILALNVSIEASRAGEAGKNFISVSDRIKDFGEKSSQIGNAILEELKDSDISIRKAYALGKDIMEYSSLKTSPSTSQKQEQDPETVQAMIATFEELFKLSMKIQSVSSELEDNINNPSEPDLATNTVSIRTFELTKDMINRSFERLYRLNYGIDPPVIPSSSSAIKEEDDHIIL